jgi:anti-anti-sigma factor
VPTQDRFLFDPSADRPTVRVVGDVDFSRRAEFEGVLAQAAGSKRLAISFLECSFCDSSIIGALMKMRAAHPDTDVALLVAPGSAVARVFELVGIDQIFTVVMADETLLPEA